MLPNTTALEIAISEVTLHIIGHLHVQRIFDDRECGLILTGLTDALDQHAEKLPPEDADTLGRLAGRLREQADRYRLPRK